MSIPTAIDLMNAAMYSRSKQIQQLCKTSSISGSIWRSETPIYFCPPGLDCPAGHCVLSQSGCESLSCFPYKAPDGAPCEPNDKACNASCYAFNLNKGKSPDIPYLEWRDGKCVIGNMFFRRWATYPKSRQDHCEVGMTNTPAFLYDINTGKASISREYCTNDSSTTCSDSTSGMNINYDEDAKECSVPAGEKFLENFVTGKTLFRNLKKLRLSMVREATKATSTHLPISKDLYKNRRILAKNYFGEGIHLEAADFTTPQARHTYDSSKECKLALFPTLEYFDGKGAAHADNEKLNKRVRVWLKTRHFTTRLIQNTVMLKKQ